jgi:hypothetical protein
MVAEALLSDDAACAKKIVADYVAPYKSIAEYFEYMKAFNLDKDAVVYDENGNATIDYKN